MSDFVPVDKETMDLITDVRIGYFTDLSDCRLTAIFDTKEKRKKFIAKICKSNDMVRYFTSDEAGEEDGYDYIIIIDQLVWESDGLTAVDRKRLIRHTLRHIAYNPEKSTRKGQYGLCKHDVEDFMVEIELAQSEGDARWKERVEAVAESIYDTMEG